MNSEHEALRAAVRALSEKEIVPYAAEVDEQERPGRKIGHVTVLGSQLAPVREVAVASATFLATGTWPDGHPVHEQGRETA